jgi:hypothetical protein
MTKKMLPVTASGALIGSGLVVRVHMDFKGVLSIEGLPTDLAGVGVLIPLGMDPR